MVKDAEGFLLWNRAPGKPVHGQQGSAPVDGAAFRPDGRVFVIVSEGRAVLWDIATCKPLPGSLEVPDPARWAWFTAGGRFLLTLGPFGEIGVRDAVTGRAQVRANALAESAAHIRLVEPAACSPDGQTIAVGDGHGIRLLGLGGRAPLSLPHPQVRALAFHPDGRRLLTVDHAGIVRLWDVASAAYRRVPWNGQVVAAECHPSGRFLLLADTERVVLWDDERGKAVGSPHRYTCTGNRGFALSPNGKAYVTAHDKTVTIRDAATDALILQSAGLPGDPTMLQFSADGRVAATLLAGGEVFAWEAGTGKTLGNPLNRNEPVSAMAVSPDGQRVLTGQAEGWLQ